MIKTDEPMIGNQTLREYLKMFGHSDEEIENVIKNYYLLPKPTLNLIEIFKENEIKKIRGGL